VLHGKDKKNKSAEVGEKIGERFLFESTVNHKRSQTHAPSMTNKHKNMKISNTLCFLALL
jgi:hypothetical protein